MPLSHDASVLPVSLTNPPESAVAPTQYEDRYDVEEMAIDVAGYSEMNREVESVVFTSLCL